MEELEDDPSSEMLAIELYRPAVFAARTFDLLLCTAVGYLPAMIWPRILVFTSMMLRVLNPAAFGSYGAGILYS